jgi:4-diphosphocytidyl-2-C-methyl-D-erythritol kinase
MGSVTAPAKLNLRLVVLAREEGGFHQIETIFARIDLADEIEITPGAKGIRLRVANAQLGPLEDNLVFRAARAFQQRIARQLALDITLIKHVPAGAGLGGGSSDAAATLAELNRLHGTPLETHELHALAATLGSDVPFFLSPAPFAIAWGRGERVLPLTPPPAAHVLIGIADEPVSTAEAYTLLAAHRRQHVPGVLAPLPAHGDLASWEMIGRYAVNDFEAVLQSRLRGAATLRACFEEAGARVARLTGSGAAVFGIFDDAAELEAAAKAAIGAAPHAQLIRTHTAFG